MPDETDSQVKYPKRHRFTKENASEFSKRGLAARLKALRDKEELFQALKRKALETESQLKPSEEYTQKRVSQVREQIDKLNSLIAACDEPHALDRLFSALAKACELERVLSGRPLPGSRKPPSEKLSKRITSSIPD